MASIARQSLRPAVAAARMATVPRVAAFTTTSRRSLLPPGPQVVVGTVNDAVPVPDAHPAHGSYHWTFDRVLAVGLIPLTFAPFVGGSLNPTTDAILCGTMLVHSHMGFNNIITDYIPSRQFPKSRKAADWGLVAATLLVGAGLYEFETNDVGVTETIKRVWKA
ncbi:Succinate dehydrogenase [ubiquinone] cytochrome b small subunit mitochondrial [Ceratocystis platani]|uniref:Succinate dehydrogenase [ubiquinone] cytochrome b small subunit n=1 Tax=Ceratocystis fimbriata f. sp. platani TaxID=88771 RepID=A0A0F8D9T6_CERFI|nr:Succinate dehydrogenase [ubiquinone] cytochrome b small subunit mitochondrial [Ceratocystis platani]